MSCCSRGSPTRAGYQRPVCRRGSSRRASSSGGSTRFSSASSRTRRPRAPGLLGELGRGVVADRGRERGHHREAVLDQRLGALAAGLDPAQALLLEHARGAREQADRLEQVPRDHRDRGQELELTGEAGGADRRVVPDHLRGDLQHDLADHRVDLAGHDRRAGLDRGQRELAQPAARAGAEQAHVRGDLRQRQRDARAARRSPRRRRRARPAPRSGPALPRGAGRWRARARRSRARRSRAGSSGRCRRRCRRARARRASPPRARAARGRARPGAPSPRTPGRAAPASRP